MTDDSGSVAIVGMACRFPGADDVGAFWANLRAGAETITRFAPDRLTAAGVPPELAEHPDYVPARGVVSGGEFFDWAHFGYSRGEAAGIDPQHRVLLECAATALDDAAIDPARLPGLVGVFAGCDSARDAGLDVLAGDPPVTESVGRDKDFLATRVAYKLGLRGPALTIQTACSTGLVAVHVAAQNVLSYECDVALAGGVSLVLPQECGYRYLDGGILSPDGRCRPFDADAAGTVPSAGVGLVVLRRLTEARADGSRILAVIRGSAVNNDGNGKIGYTAPSVTGQRDVITMALARANVEPTDVSYVEAHGTGTALGDPVELAGLTAALDGDAGADPGRAGPRWLGAVKANIGHTGAAAGVAGLIKTVSMLGAGELVPTPHFRRPNPELDLGSFRVATANAEWRGPSRSAVLLAGVSSFGIGGTNAHAILEAAPTLRPRAGGTSRPRVLCLSAADPAALSRTRAELADHLAADPQSEPADVELTLAIGRRRFDHRIARVVQDGESASRALLVDPAESASVAVDGPGRVAFAFPGADDFRVGSGTVAHRWSPAFRRAFDEVGALVDVDLSPVVDPDADPDWAVDPVHRWLGAFALGWALATQLDRWGVRPAALCGVGAGERVAAVVAGRSSLADVLDARPREGSALDEQARGDHGLEGLRALCAEPGTLIIELGAGDSLAGFARRHGGGRAIGMLGDAGGPLAVAAALWEHGVDLDWDDLLADGDARRCALPSYPFTPRSLHSNGRPPSPSGRGGAAELVADISWPGRTALSTRRDLRARLERYCVGLIADLASRSRIPTEPSEPTETSDEDGLEGPVLPLLAGLLERTLAADDLQDPAVALTERDALGEITGLRDLVEHCVSAYPAVFAGELAPLSVLFPDAEDTVLRAGYERNDIPVNDGEVCLGALVDMVHGLRAQRTNRGQLRILEVGAGQGDLASRVLTELPDVDYHVTDVSPLLVRRAAARLDGVTASVFDITADPIGQGLVPASYDLVLAHNVVHVAPDVRTAIGHLARLLMPDGVLGMVEVTRVDLWNHLVWGLAPGWWSFADDIRETSPHLPAETWMRVLQAAGFDAAWSAPPGDPDHALVVGRLSTATSPADPTEAVSATPTGPATSTVVAVSASAASTKAVSTEAVSGEAGLWMELLGTEVPPRDDDDFFAEGGDSLLAVKLIADVRERLGARISLPEFTDEPTFVHLVHLVQVVREADEVREAVPGLVRLRDGDGDLPPLALAAPAAGSPQVYRALAGLLRDDRQVVGLEAPGLRGGEPPLSRIEDIADRHVAALRARFPDGPYVLGGWSVGAVVAHEMARRMPDEVTLLACLDGHPRAVDGWWGARAVRGARYHAAAGRQLAAVADLSGEAGGFLAVYHAAIRAMVRYRPAPVTCPAVVFQTGLRGRGARSVGAGSPGADARRVDRLRRRLGSFYPAGVEVRLVPGDHWSVLAEPDVTTLAAAIDEVLP